MKKSVLMTALAAMMLASCTFEEGRVTQQHEIDFSVAPYAAQTKAEHDLNTAFTSPFQVWAWHSRSNTAVINGKEANHEPEGWIVDGGPYYWPSGTTLDFIAITPPNNQYCTITREADGGTLISYAFTESKPNPRDMNLMHTDFIEGQGSGVVALGFRHALCKISVTVHQTTFESSRPNVLYNEVVLTHMSVGGIYRQGSYSLTENDNNKNRSPQVWTPSGDTTGIDYLPASRSLLIKDGLGNPSLEDYTAAANKYVMPQVLTDDAKFTIKYHILAHTTSGTQTSETITVPIQINQIRDTGASPITQWSTNKIINYTINITPEFEPGGITFDVKEEEWGTIVSI